MIILMLKALWFDMCSNMLPSRGQCGVFSSLIAVYQNHSELLQLQKDEAGMNIMLLQLWNTQVTFITNFNYINLKMEESTSAVLNEDLNESFKVFHELGPFIK